MSYLDAWLKSPISQSDTIWGTLILLKFFSIAITNDDHFCYKYHISDKLQNLCWYLQPGNTKGGSITVPLTSCLTGLDESVLQIKTKIVSCNIADSKLVKQEANGTVILPPSVFPASTQISNWHKVSLFVVFCVEPYCIRLKILHS